jgi:antitoxin Phd
VIKKYDAVLGQNKNPALKALLYSHQCLFYNEKLVRLDCMKTTKFNAQARWQLQTAKARFSEVFRRARAEGPQYVTRQGKEAVVILPAEEFERLTERTRQPRSLVKFFAESPLAGSGVDLERKPDYGRKIDL